MKIYKDLELYVRAIQGGADVDKVEFQPYPCGPTSHYPGTREKIEVLRQRVENNQELYHPDDARWEDFDPGAITQLSDDPRLGLVLERSIESTERELRDYYSDTDTDDSYWGID
jgi:hypothetical protein